MVYFDIYISFISWLSINAEQKVSLNLIWRNFWNFLNLKNIILDDVGYKKYHIGRSIAPTLYL